jgi:hypothetical protein
MIKPCPNKVITSTRKKKKGQHEIVKGFFEKIPKFSPKF